MSALEETLVWQVKMAGLPAPDREVVFAPPRKWRADLCWHPYRLIVEVEGGTWIQGRHSRGAGMRKDCEKYNAAALDGWRVLRFTGDMIRDGSALTVVERALGTR